MNWNSIFKEHEAIALLKTLVSIPSINPGERFLWQSPYGEARIGNYITDYLVNLGVRVHKQKVFKCRFNVIGIIKGRDSRYKILWLGHMDTVSAEGMVKDPFRPIVESGRLFGRGSCDAKGPLVSMLLAISIIRKNRFVPAHDLYFASVVDEEYTGQGVKKLLTLGIDWLAAVVAEPTNLNIITTHKGCLRFRVTTKGKGAHSSAPARGVNAIYIMAEAIQLIRKVLEPRYKKKLYPMVGSPTINIGVIQGGQGPNIVPDRCTIEIDRRLCPGEDPEQVMGEISRLFTSSGLNSQKLVMEKPYVTVMPLETSVTEPLVTVLKDNILKAGFSSRITGGMYTSDGSYLGAAGIPTVLFGPGDIRQAHHTVEYINVRQVLLAAEILVRFVLTDLKRRK